MSDYGPRQPMPETENQKEDWLEKLTLQTTQDRLIAHTMSKGFSYDDAKDITQQVMFKAIRAIKADQFRGDSPLMPWLYRIAKNETINLIRQRQGHPETDSISNGLDLPSKEPTSEEKYITAEAAKNLRSHFDKLTPKMRELMELLADGLNLTEIAKHLNTNYMTISNRYFRARQLLKKWIPNEDKK